MAKRAIGILIGDETTDEQNAAGAAFITSLGSLLPTQEQSAEFSKLCAQIMGDVLVRHVPGYVGFTTVAPNTGGGLDYPIPAIVMQVDNSGNFVALWWKSDDAPTKWKRIDAGWVSPFPGYYEGPMVAVGSDTAGDSFTLAHGNHSHPPGNPAIDGTYLFSAKKSDPLVRVSARCLLPWGAETGTLFSSLWTQIAGVSTWQWSGFAGQLLGFDSSGSPTIVLQDGDIVVSWCPVTVEPPWTDPVHFFTYEVVDCGFHMVGGFGVSTKPVIRRTSDANTPSGLRNGAYVRITGSGVQYEGKYLRITTADPIEVDVTPLTLELLDTMSAAVSYELLTSTQLVTEPADNDTADLVCSQSFGGDTPFPQAFLTLAGTPGLTSIPAGLQSFRVEQVTVGTAANSGTVTLKLRAYIIDADGSTIIGTAFTAESPPLSLSSSSFVLEFQYNLASSVTLTSAQRLLLMPILSTDITQLVTLTIRYNSASRGTWWKTTMNFASFGTTNHLLLENTAQDVGAGQQADHPWSAIGPSGRIHTKIGVGTESGGLITLPTDCNSCEVSIAGSTVLGINAEGFLPGDVVRITITNASAGTTKTLMHNQGPSSPYKGLFLAKDNMSAYQSIVIKNSPARMAFQLNRVGDSWHLVERLIA
jgi:hypothetical protein